MWPRIFVRGQAVKIFEPPRSPPPSLLSQTWRKEFEKSNPRKQMHADCSIKIGFQISSLPSGGNETSQLGDSKWQAAIWKVALLTLLSYNRAMDDLNLKSLIFSTFLLLNSGLRSCEKMAQGHICKVLQICPCCLMCACVHSKCVCWQKHTCVCVGGCAFVRLAFHM